MNGEDSGGNGEDGQVWAVREKLEFPGLTIRGGLKVQMCTRLVRTSLYLSLFPGRTFLLLSRPIFPFLDCLNFFCPLSSY
jgi:hypothetical protein